MSEVGVRSARRMFFRFTCHERRRCTGLISSSVLGEWVNESGLILFDQIVFLPAVIQSPERGFSISRLPTRGESVFVQYTTSGAATTGRCSRGGVRGQNIPASISISIF